MYSRVRCKPLSLLDHNRPHFFLGCFFHALLEKPMKGFCCCCCWAFLLFCLFCFYSHGGSREHNTNDRIMNQGTPRTPTRISAHVQWLGKGPGACVTDATAASKMPEQWGFVPSGCSVLTVVSLVTLPTLLSARLSVIQSHKKAGFQVCILRSSQETPENRHQTDGLRFP